MRLQSDPPSWKIVLDWAPAGRERLRLGREAAEGCGENTVPAQVPGCHLMVTKAAAGLPPTSAGTSLILAEKRQGSRQENVPADEADKLQPGGRGRRGSAFGGVGGRQGQRWETCGIGGMPSSPSPALASCLSFPIGRSGLRRPRTCGCQRALLFLRRVLR